MGIQKIHTLNNGSDIMTKIHAEAKELTPAKVFDGATELKEEAPPKMKKSIAEARRDEITQLEESGAVGEEYLDNIGRSSVISGR